jgi:uncharacterized phage protein (TIGR02218 family)
VKTLSAGTLTHIAQETTTLSTCWKITRRDAQVFGFTDAVDPMTIDGVVYVATSGYTRTAISSDSALSVDNLDLQGVLSNDAITEADLLAGLWDFAEVRIFQVNRADTTQQIKQRRGWLGEVTLLDTGFTVELRGLAQVLQSSVGELYSASCRADLGDTRCGVDLGPLTVSDAVDSVTSQRQFACAALVEADDYWKGGLVSFTSGLNTGLSMEVRAYTVGVVTLQQPMPYTIAAADTFDIRPGCDKALATCRDTYNNVINFRGEPYVPGIDTVLAGPT